MKTITVILVIAQVGLLTACRGETNAIPDNYFKIPGEGYPVSVEESGSAKVDALVRNLVSRRPAPYRSGYSDPPTAVVFADRYSTPEVEAALKNLSSWFHGTKSAFRPSGFMTFQRSSR